MNPVPGAKSGAADAADATPRRPGAAVAADVRWAPAAAPDQALVDRAWAYVRDQALAAAGGGGGSARGEGGARFENQDSIVAQSEVLM